MEVVLFMFRADGATRSFPLTRDVTVIGRREDCDLRIPLTEVSRKHCRIVVGSDDVRIEDLGSSNGTLHNGQRIQESVAKPGDYLQVGPVTFAFQIDGVPEEDQIAPPNATEDVLSQPPAEQSSTPEESASQAEEALAMPEQETMQPAPFADPDDDDAAEIIIDDLAPEENERADDDIIDLGDNKR